MDLANARTYDVPFSRLTDFVAPFRARQTKQVHEPRYWIHWDRREEFFEKVRTLDRVVVFGVVSKHHAFTFGLSDWVFYHGVVVVADNTWARFGTLQSSWHQVWVERFKSTMRLDTSYSVSKCFLTFPFPHRYAGSLDVDAERYFDARREVARTYNIGLTKIYNAFHDPGNTDPLIERLRRLQQDLDRSVAECYGWDVDWRAYDFVATPQGDRFRVTEESARRMLELLVALNAERYGSEVAAGLHEKKKGTKRKRNRSPVGDQGTLDGVS
jgi:hypothetical protein